MHHYNQIKNPVPEPYRVMGRAFLEDNYYNGVIIVLTLLALFMDDCRLWFFPKSADETFGIISCFIFAIFMAELIFSSFVQNKYLWKFFFWLDLVAALSLIPDIPYIWDKITGVDSNSDNTDAQDSLTVARAARSARAGTKAGRIVRFVRLIRLIRVAKLLEICSSNAARKKREEEAAMIAEMKKSMSNGNTTGEESKVGQFLSEKTTRKVVMMVLLMLFAIPALIPDTEETSPEVAVAWLAAASNEATVPSSAWDNEVQFVMDYYEDDREVIYLNVTGSQHNTFHQDINLGDFRTIELTSAAVGDAEILLSYKYYNQMASSLSVFLTLLVIFILTVGALLINKTTTQLVVQPIEQMLQLVHRLQKDPLGKLQISKADDDNETGQLEATLLKLTYLLQCGFGEAGSAMISRCMSTETGGGQFNPIIQGQRVIGIFGFCDIRRFTDATECLREEVMMYVNEIAAVVHGIADSLDGNPNKNVGDAFLLVWRLPAEASGVDEAKLRDLIHYCEHVDNTTCVYHDGHEQKTNVRRSDEMDVIRAACGHQADNALVAILRIITHINTSVHIQRYCQHESIVQAFDEFSVRLGFGLHVGWSIEGPIGSSFKIDASYLSPNVNLAETLEGTTKAYGAPLLISGEFYALMTRATKERCRLLDCITTEGRKEEPLMLWAFDFCDESMEKVNAEGTNDVPDIDGPPAEALFGEKKIEENLKVKGHRLSALQAGINPQFWVEYKKGIDCYLNGDWPSALEFFGQALEARPDDKPTKEIVKYIKEELPAGRKCSDDWRGCREI